MRHRSVGALLLLPVAFAMFLYAVPVRSETLSWTAPTLFTDGSAISGTVDYVPFWSANSDLSAPHPLGNGTTATSVTFGIDAAGMPRGATVYFSCRAVVNGISSDNASALAWNVPVIPPPPKVPSPPTNLRLQ